jgi:DNA polymerase-3 subunit epsilon
MNIQLKKPLFFFDLETTGTDIVHDRIVELAYIKLMPDGKEEAKTRRINPEIPIPAAATEIHGITDEDVKDCPTFKQIAKSLATIIGNSDLAGFNAARFDIPLLAEEFLRADVEIDFSNRKFLDMQEIYHTMEPRNLSAAYRFYCDKELEGAHGAAADTRATFEVLFGQLERYKDLPCTVDELITEMKTRNPNKNPDRVDFAGRMIYVDGKEVFNFGKYKGKSVEEALAADPSYYDWIQKGDFTGNTKNMLQRIYLRMKSNNNVLLK